jgi:hypothetical protein
MDVIFRKIIVTFAKKIRRIDLTDSRQTDNDLAPDPLISDYKDTII